MTLIDFLHTAFAELYDLNEQMTNLYEEYADNHGRYVMLERAGRISSSIRSKNFYDVKTKLNK